MYFCMYLCKFLKTSATLNRISSLCAICDTFVLVFLKVTHWKGGKMEAAGGRILP